MAGLLDALSQTWPARMGKGLIDAVQLPGQVAGGLLQTQPQQPGMWSDVDEARQQATQGTMMNRAADLGGMVMGGSYAAAPAMKNATGMGIRAYHGSPYNFDKFDIRKIGDGEGAQVYGHGLYFAENEAVAKAYRDQLAMSKIGPSQELAAEFFKPGRIVDGYGGPDKVLDFKKTENGWATLVQRLEPDGTPYGRPRWHSSMPDKREWEKAVGRPPGHMYEVDIKARPEQFLDWDKPLSAQAESIQKMFAPVVDPQRQKYPNLDPKGDVLYRWAEGGRLASSADDFTANVGGGNAANRFKEAGIPGIKYLDQGSRGAGEGSRNYVVFDDKLVDILRKYGLIGGAATGAMYQGSEAQAAP